MKIKSFKQFLNEFEIEGDVVQGKPLWNGIDYLDNGGDINLSGMDLTELPCTFPEKWEEGFYCFTNQLTSLEGAPREVEGNFNCSKNQLASLEGAPREVKGNFYCSNNHLTSLEGAPRDVEGSFYCTNNKVKFTKDDVRQVCDVLQGNIYV